jgi:hypothetical protein
VNSQLLKKGDPTVLEQRSNGGVVRVPSNLPTTIDAPWIVRYSVRDSAGNAAQVVLRLVVIKCEEVGLCKDLNLHACPDCSALKGGGVPFG